MGYQDLPAEIRSNIVGLFVDSRELLIKLDLNGHFIYDLGSSAQNAVRPMYMDTIDSIRRNKYVEVVYEGSLELSPARYCPQFASKSICLLRDYGSRPPVIGSLHVKFDAAMPCREQLFTTLRALEGWILKLALEQRKWKPHLPPFDHPSIPTSLRRPIAYEISTLLPIDHGQRLSEAFDEPETREAFEWLLAPLRFPTGFVGPAGEFSNTFMGLVDSNITLDPVTDVVMMYLRFLLAGRRRWKKRVDALVRPRGGALLGYDKDNPPEEYTHYLRDVLGNLKWFDSFPKDAMTGWAALQGEFYDGYFVDVFCATAITLASCAGEFNSPPIDVCPYEGCPEEWLALIGVRDLNGAMPVWLSGGWHLWLAMRYLVELFHMRDMLYAQIFDASATRDRLASLRSQMGAAHPHCGAIDSDMDFCQRIESERDNLAANWFEEVWVEMSPQQLPLILARVLTNEEREADESAFFVADEQKNGGELFARESQFWVRPAQANRRPETIEIE